jgi:uncharacterized protein YdaU (DUF1376 family)
MKTDAWMPLYIGDYLADTMHLTAEQHGAYLLLLMAHWRRPEGLPNDADFLAATAKVTPEVWLSIASAVTPFFELKDGVFRSKRVVSERAKADSVHARRSKAGRKGGKVCLSRASVLLKPGPTQSQSQSHSVLFKREPSEEDVIAAGDRAGITPAICSEYYRKRMAIGWVDRNGNTIKSMPHDLASFAAHFIANNNKPKGSTNGSSVSSGRERIARYRGTGDPSQY